MVQEKEHDARHWVDLLRSPFRVHVLQRVPGVTAEEAAATGEEERAPGTRIASAEHAALLAQLRDAITGGIGSHAGGGSAGSERLPFDAGARSLYDSIESEVSAWYVRLTQMPVHLLPERTLFGLFNVLELGADDMAKDLFRRRVAGWVKAIEAMFDPPLTRESTEPCPSCGERWAHDAKTGDRVSALVFRYRDETPDQPAHVISAECRFEGETWAGEAQVEFLVGLMNGEAADAALVDGLVKEEES